MANSIDVQVTASEVTATADGRSSSLPTTVTLRPGGRGIFGRRWNVDISPDGSRDADGVPFSLFVQDSHRNDRISRIDCLSWYFVALVSPLLSGFPKLKVDLTVRIEHSLLARLAPDVPASSALGAAEAFLAKALVRVARKVRIEAS